MTDLKEEARKFRLEKCVDYYPGSYEIPSWAQTSIQQRIEEAYIGGYRSRDSEVGYLENEVRKLKLIRHVLGEHQK